MLAVHSIFTSIEGEVCLTGQGRICTFVRLAGCNCQCTYCDTPDSLTINESTHHMSVPEVFNIIESLRTHKVTITGGEPLMQGPAVFDLTKLLYNKGYMVSIETNGTQDLVGYNVKCFVVDFKLTSSGMRDRMQIERFYGLRSTDFVKFVVMSIDDVAEAIEVMKELRPKTCAQFAVSYDSSKHNHTLPWYIMKQLINNDLADCYVNVQLHKMIGMP